MKASSCAKFVNVVPPTQSDLSLDTAKLLFESKVNSKCVRLAMLFQNKDERRKL